MKNQIKLICCLVLTILMINLFSTIVLGSTGLPWETPLQTIQRSLSGPVAVAIAIIAIVVSGFMYAFGESGSMFKHLCFVALAISLALGAATFVSAVFSPSSGALCLLTPLF
jgi:type IV secretory pathway VirB2 component (pilin)